MQYETIGKSNTKISKLCLGCMSFGSKLDWMIELDDAKPIIDCALDLGITFFDTANAYSNGRSEEIVGELLKDCRNDVVIGTKVRYQMGKDPNDIGLSKEQIKKQFLRSLKRLQTKFIDLYQIHRWDYDTPIKETLVAMNQLVEDNQVLHLGASNMWTWQFAKCVWLCNKLDLHRLETMQTHYNLCYREEEREMIPFCKDQKISLFSYNPVAKGFLTGKYKRDTENDGIRFKSDPGFKPKFFKPQDYDVLETVVKLANEKDVKPVQIALAWSLKKDITLPIIGVTKKNHVEEAVESLNVKLTDDDIKQLEEPYQVQNINHLD
jgi:1-deoxyxylulose-5-phosphate synthase